MAKGHPDLSYGNPLNFPHYSVIGSTEKFYMWCRKNSNDRGNATEWIMGRDAFGLYNELRNVHKDKQLFIEKFMAEYDKRPKMYNW